MGNMVEVNATLTFGSDIMYDRFTEEDQQQIEEGKTSKTKKQKPDMEKEIIRRAHINDRSEFVIPNEWAYGAVVEALKFQKVGMMSLSRMLGALDIIGDSFVVMRNGKPVKVGDHIPDTRSCNGGVGPNKVKIIKHRARLVTSEDAPLAVSFVVRFDEDKINPFQIKQAIEDAGQLIGIGSFRPEHKGRFGKFHLSNLKLIRKWSEADRCEMDEATAALFQTQGGKNKDAVAPAKGKARKTA